MSNQNQQSVLCVDSDAKVTAMVQSTLKSLGVLVQSANSGGKALEILEKAAIDVVIADRQLPDMDAVEFLRKTRELQPHAQRILLSDSTELESVVSIINEGGLAGFIVKPCEKVRLKQLVSASLSSASVYRDNGRRLEESEAENGRLSELVAELEKQVAEASIEVDVAHAALQKSMDELKFSYEAMVDLCANLAAKPGVESMSTRKKIALALAMGEELKFEEHELIDLRRATRLHRIGWAALPPGLTDRPKTEFTHEELREFRKHSLYGEAILLGIPELRQVGAIIRSQTEWFDGTGVPDGKTKESIPTASKIIALARDYYDSLHGRLLVEPLDSREALQDIEDRSGKQYDPDIVAVFLKVLPRVESIDVNLVEKKLETRMLQPGMILARDLTTQAGTLLLNKGAILQERVIETLVNLEDKSGNRLDIHVEMENVN